MNNQQVNQYLSNQLSRAPAMLRTYTHDEQGHKYLTRNIYIRLQKLINDFIEGQKEIRIVSIPGLRGVGKTTLLAQLFLNYYPQHPQNMLYLSVDQIVNELNSNLYTVLEEYQKILGASFENLDKMHFLFFDEIHFDSNWTSVLKTLYDKTKKVFVVCTGSSALSLQSTTDLARRVVFEKLFPMNFTEYLMLQTRYKSLKNKDQQIKFPIKGLKNQLKQAIFHSSNAKQCFDRLQENQSLVENYWRNVDSLHLNQYLRYGSMPYALTIKNEQRIHTLTSQQIDRVVEKDIPEISQFSTETLSAIKNILLLVAGSSEVSLTSLAKSLHNISPVTLINILDSLEKAEMLIRVYPYGSTYKKVRKPSKYHFMTPAMRHTLLTFLEGETAFLNHKGKYLEDIVALTFYREFSQKLSSPIFYDSSGGGADFVLRFPQKKIAIEVGLGGKDISQAQSTLEKTQADYGLVISNSPLSLKEKIIKIPLKYFLLL